MPGTMCAVYCCKNNLKITKTLGKDISYHTFPKDVEPERLKTWILKTNRADNFNPKTAHICSDHFTDKDFKRNLQAELLNQKVKRQLNKSAVPSLKLFEKDSTNTCSVIPESGTKRVKREDVQKIDIELVSSHKELSKTTDIDHPHLAFKHDHAYLKTTHIGEKAVQLSKTKISPSGTPKYFVNQELNTKERLSSIKSNTTNAPLRKNSQNTTQGRLQKSYPLSQQIVPKKHIKGITKPIKCYNNKDNDKVNNKILFIKLPSNVLKDIQKGDKLFLCMECNEVFTEHKDFLDHQMTHDNFDKNVVCNETEKKEPPFFINNKSSVNVVKNENITNSVKNVDNMSKPVFKFKENFPANSKEQKVFFQGECSVCHLVFEDLRKHVETVHKNNLCKNEDDYLEFHCHKCHMVFEIQSQLIAHNLSAHNDTNSHTCEHCFKDFLFQKDLDSHIKIHHSISLKYLCPYCDVGFSHSNGLITHLTKHTGSNAIENKANVNEVDYSTTRPEQLNMPSNKLNHNLVDKIENYIEEIAIDSDQVWVSEDVNEYAVIPSSFNSVINNNATTDVEIKEEYVDNNSVIFSQEQESFIRNNGRYTVCRICMEIVSYSMIGKHMKNKHNNAAPYQCEICCAEFYRKHVMDDHRRKHTNDKPHKCDDCSKCFTYKHHLNRHKKLLHNADPLQKPFICTVCHKAFPFKEYLTLHFSSHHNGKRFVCQICGKSFFTKAVLTKHYWTHTDERPFMCEHCGLTFKYKTSCDLHTKNMHLRDNQRVLSPEKYECDVCNKTFTTKVYRDMHYKRHNGEGHLCNLCPKLFVSKSHLHRHIKLMHTN